jgi:hypothetical protein
MYLKSIKSVENNAAKSVNRSILKKCRYLGFGVSLVYSSMVLPEGTLHLELTVTSSYLIVDSEVHNYSKKEQPIGKGRAAEGEGRGGGGS